MNKWELSRALAHGERETVLALAKSIEERYPVRVIRGPEKTLVMIQAKDSVQGTPFYLGEIVAVECLVDVAKQHGGTVLMGSDFEKARAMAILDAAHSAGLPEMIDIITRVETLDLKRISLLSEEAARHRKTQVRFRILEDKYAE